MKMKDGHLLLRCDFAVGIPPAALAGEGVARRGGLQRRSEAKPMEVRSDRTPQPEREHVK